MAAGSPEVTGGAHLVDGFPTEYVIYASRGESGRAIALLLVVLLEEPRLSRVIHSYDEDNKRCEQYSGSRS